MSRDLVKLAARILAVLAAIATGGAQSERWPVVDGQCWCRSQQQKQRLQVEPGHKCDFDTQSFALELFRWLIVVHILKISAAKSSDFQHFWRVSRVESSLLEDHVK